MASPTRLPSLRRTAGQSRPVSMIERPHTNIPDFSNISTEVESSKKSNRGSLLFQFPRKTPVEAQESAPATEEVQGRHSRPSEEARKSSESGGRRAIDEERQSMLSSSKMARPTSMIPPRSSSSKTTKSRSHHSTKRKDAKTDANIDVDADVIAVRADSLAALQGTVPVEKPTAAESGLQRSASTKLPQIPRNAGPSIPSRTTSVKLKEGQSHKTKHKTGIQTAAVITITEERTSASKLEPEQLQVSTKDQTTSSFQHSSTRSHTRTPSQTTQTTSPPCTSVTSRPRPASQIILPSSKPSFNTYQQHYSPAKSALPKPPIPPPKPIAKPATAVEDDMPVNLDVTKQQIELLQLSLLYQSSTKCMNDYTASAKRKLSKMHSKLRKDYESLRATELVHQRATNLSALDTWCPDTGLLVENLQILSLVHSDLSALMEEGSRHSDVVSMFELWMNEAEEPESRAFIQPLPDDWKAAHASLVLKLRSIQRNFRVLPPIQSGGETSAVGEILKACKTLIEDMLKELEVMGKLENEVMARERVKADEEVQALLTSDVEMGDVWVPAWRGVE